MTESVAMQAAAAMRWRACQLAGVQGVYFLRLLILARLLAPDAFGLLAIATVSVGVFMRLSNVGMIPALVQHQDATREQHDGAWTVGLLRAGLVALGLFIAAPIVARLFNEPLATPIIQALALRPLIDSLASIGIVRLTRELRFRELMLIYFPGAVVDLCTAVLTAPTLGVWALVAGALVGSSTTVLLSYALAPHRPRLAFQWREIAPLVNYGRWVLATGIVALAGTLLTQLAVSRMLGATALGLYFLALKVAFLPIETVSSVVGEVAFPMFARLKDDARGSAASFGLLLGGLYVLLLPVYCLVFVLAPALQEALGSRWIGTAPIIQVLSVAGVTAIVGGLLGPLLMGRGLANHAFRLEIVQTAMLLVVLMPALWLLDLPGAAVAWLLGNTAAMVVALVWVQRIVPGALRRARRRAAAAFVAGVLAATTAWTCSVWLDGLVGLVVAGTAGVAIASAVLWILNARLRLELGELHALFFRRAQT